MSGICGIVAIGSWRPLPDEISSMTDRLEQRGPDGTHHWLQDRVAFGHTLLATTPEALIEVLPLTKADSGCTIVADARIDNREELFAQLALDARSRVIGDGELILEGYLRWGEACVDHLLGDFAFAIWDTRAKRLFCARDHIGMRQLNYCLVPGEMFAIATDPRAILSLDRAPKRLNEARIADFLEDLEAIDFISTFYEGIYRLPPAHSLTLQNGELQIGRYWRLETDGELELPSDEAYANAFLEVFTEAVRCRLRSAKPVGSMLSGGMDSGAVTAVAARELSLRGEPPLLTFSAIGPDSQTCVETRAIGRSMTMPGIKPSAIYHDALGSARAELLRLIRNSAEPFDAHMTLPRAVYWMGHSSGVNVMLDGVGGDIVLASKDTPSWLFKKRRLLACWREHAAESKFWKEGRPAWLDFLRTTWVNTAPPAVQAARMRFRHWLHDHRANRTGLVSPELARAVRLTERRAQDRAQQRSSEAGPIPSFHYLVAGRERYDRVAADLAIEPRDPFLDLRVIRFCRSLPPTQLQAGGWPKIILRRAMLGYMSSKVIWRRGKEHLGGLFTKAVFNRDQIRSSEWQGSSTTNYISQVQNGTDGDQHSTLLLDSESRMTLIYLSNWLMNWADLHRAPLTHSVMQEVRNDNG